VVDHRRGGCFALIGASGQKIDIIERVIAPSSVGSPVSNARRTEHMT
jgi:hypothetical protein